MRKLDVIIPVKNEAENVRELVIRLDQALSGNKVRYKAIFVDDHSTDSTVSLLEEMAKQYPIEIHEKKGKPGKAYSILEGAQHTTSDYVAMIDGDLQYPPEALPEMLELTPRHGMVVANRTNNSASKLRKFVSAANRMVIGRFLLGMKCDVQSGLKVFHRSIIEQVDRSQVAAWAIDMPLLYTARELGYDITCVDITFSDRKAGASKVSLIRTSKEIAVSAMKLKLASKKVYRLMPSQKSMRGSGVVHKKRTYITHSQLHPAHSAIHTLTGGQKIFLVGLLGIIAAGIYVNPLGAAIGVVAFLSLIYFADTVFNFFLVFKSLHFPPELSFSQKELLDLKDYQLPVYTILCPLYREAAVLPEFIESMSNLDWPEKKLEVLLLLEEDDDQTLEAVKRMKLPSFIQPVIVPNSQPKTKPKACNYGLSIARGEYVVIYDAEDRPDPQQLKKAYLGFKHSPANVACLQAKLNYYNPHHNLITRLFTAEYSLWFDMVLPGLQSINTTIPLGGTSNHFRTKILHELKGWDAFNVTEDADLGARLFKMGYRTSIIDSTTLEEANSHLGNWVRQRSRWIKGYIQTYLVHNRHPLQFIKTQGIHAFIFQLVVGGKIAFMVINPFLWVATISYFALYSLVGPAIEALYPSVIFYMATISLVFGNFLFMYYYMIGCAKRGHWTLIKFVYLIPFYWLLVSFAAAKAFIQLAVRPHYWEKTIHGLHLGMKSKEIKAATVISVPVPVMAPVTLPEITVIPSARPAMEQAPRQTFKMQFPLLKKITSPIVTSGGALVLSAGIANVFNFLYNAYLGRTVSLEQFGIISLVGSFTYFSMLPSSALNSTLTYKSGLTYGKHHAVLKKFWQMTRKKTFLLSLLFTNVWIAVSPFMAAYFHAENILPFILFAPIWIFSTTGAIDTGFLSGHLRFVTLAILNVIDAAGKLIIAVLLVNLGLGQYAYASIPLSAALAFTVGWVAVHRMKQEKVAEDVQISTAFPHKFFATAIITKISTIVFLSLDVVLVKHFLSPYEAGQYALLSLVGKMVFFAGTLFSQFIVPIVSHAEGAGKNSKRVFYKILTFTAMAGLASYIGVGIFGYVTVPILFGSRADQILSYLPLYTLAMVAYTLAISIVSYHQTKRHYEFPLMSLGFAVLTIVGISLFHSNITAVNHVMVSVGIMYLVTALIFHTVKENLNVISFNLSTLGDLLFASPDEGVEKTENLRILIFNWYDTKHVWGGGAEEYIHNIAKKLVQNGHSVTMFCGNDLHNPRYEVLDGINIVRRGGLYTVAIWGFLYYMLKFRGKFDLILDIPKGVPFFTPLFAREPIVCLVHHVHQEMFRTGLKFPVKQFSMFLEAKLMPWVYRNITMVTVSDSSRHALREIGFGKHKQIYVVNPGVDIARVSTEKTTYPSLLYLGRIRKYKSIDILIRAVAIASKSVPQVKLTIAGSGEDEKRLKEMVRHMKLENHVNFAGKVSEAEKARLFSQTWISVQPSMVEGWGITNIEANMCGTPVVASDVEGLRDSVINGKTGILVKSGSPEAFANAIVDLVNNPDTLHAISENAVQWAEKFSWKESAELFEDIILQEINKPDSLQTSPELATKEVYV